MGEFELPSSSISKVPRDNESTLISLENGFLSTSYPVIPVRNVKEKIIDFSSYLNSTGRISMMHAQKPESEEFAFLLIGLKKNIKTILTELGKVNVKNSYAYSCSQCDEDIIIDPDVNAWWALQKHEHVENEFVDRFAGKEISLGNLTFPMIKMPEAIPSTSSADTNNENSNDSGIEQIENETYEQNFSKIDNYDTTIIEELNLADRKSVSDNDVNSFRFNFRLCYEEPIQNKLYPSSTVQSVRKYDKIDLYTIQTAGNFKTVCLLCPCELVSRTRVSKPFILDHVMGQRHLRFASNQSNLMALSYYHETFLNLERAYQAHQVYFRPDVFPAFKCVLCNQFVMPHKIKNHVMVDQHRRKVIDYFQNSENQQRPFYLIDIQVELYGKELIAEVQKRKNIVANIKPEKELKDEKKKSQKTESESSPSSDSKESIHKIIKSVDNPNSKKIFDLVPNRFRGHLKYLNLNGMSMINCKLCKVTLPQDIDTLMKHVRKASHVRALEAPSKKYNYYCEICNLRITDEAMWYKHFVEGPNKHASMAESRKNRTTEYECTTCLTVIYGDELSLTRHLSIKKKRAPKEIKLPDSVKKMFQTKEVIESESQRLTREAKEVLRNNEMTLECCNRLEAALNFVFDYGCRVHPFGSRISGLGNKYSDLDVFLDSGDMYTGERNQDSVVQAQIVRKAGNALMRLKDEFQDVIQIPTARTPIVRFFHTKTKIDCDVSFRHGLSVENTKFLKFCIDLQPITQPFILILKKWLEYNNANEHITTYALAMIAIFYLQIHSYLLSVKEIRILNPSQSLVINGWETINYTKTVEDMKAHITPYPYSLHRLLRDFFAYYANFQYSSDVVCPLLGRLIKKTDFLAGGRKLLPEMRSYVAQLVNGEDPEPFRALSPFCIQDPFDLSHNLTKACQAGTLNKFKVLCDLSSKFLDTVN